MTLEQKDKDSTARPDNFGALQRTLVDLSEIAREIIQQFLTQTPKQNIKRIFFTGLRTEQLGDDDINGRIDGIGASNASHEGIEIQGVGSVVGARNDYRGKLKVNRKGKERKGFEGRKDQKSTGNVKRGKGTMRSAQTWDK